MPSRQTAAASVFLGACIWGVYWIPLQYFAKNGVDGLWASVLVLASPLIIALPMALCFGKVRPGQLKYVAAIGLGAGAALVLYFASLVLTDVIRAIFLFYLLPIWTTAAAWILLGERPVRQRLAAIAMGLIGLWLLLGGKNGWPVPESIGDWFALVSGMSWGIALALVRKQSDMDTWTVVAATFGVGFIVSLILVGVSPSTTGAVPSLENVTAVALPALAFGSLVVWPSTCAMLWGSRFLNPSTAALLTMSELIVGVLSAAVLIGTSLDNISMIGAGVIFVAAIVDITTPDNPKTEEG